MTENESAPEAGPDPAAEATPEPEAVPSPVSEPEAEAAAVPAESVGFVEPAVSVEPTDPPEPQPHPGPEAVPSPVSEPEAEAAAVPAESVGFVEPAVSVEPTDPPEPEPQPHPGPEPVADAALEPEAVPSPVSEPEAVAGAVAAGVAAESVEPAEPVAAEQAVRNPARRRRVAALVGALLLTAGVVGGVGYTVVTVDGADRDAGAPVWTFPKATPETAKPVATTRLSRMLVPYGDDTWPHGPDIGEYGYDVELSGAHATALSKEALSGLPRTQRKALEKQIDKQRLKGISMRSYLSNPYE
ncbi:hypothetical protein ACFXKY_31425 [Streptomyces canus]|uniref:hypothetical protein n=1 Tax=Streptomyces canus TaxID=58343 RepID=UPI00369C2D3A